MTRKSSTVPPASEQVQIKHYGFAIIPRIVIRGEKYKGMSLIERGLYQGIKDICGEDGECFYTYRNLAKELNTSISTLSRYIPVLANKWKLITTEKKCRGNNTNNHEIFHIRIVSVWEENDALYKPQDCFTEKQSSVSDRNKVNGEGKTVSDRNNFVSDRNSIESSQAQLCFYLNDRMISINNTLSEGEHNSFVVANADDDSPIFSFPEVGSGITQVSDESFKIAVRDNWKIFRPATKITTSSQALEQILNRLSTSPSSELSTSVVDTPSENVENVEPTRQEDVQTEPTEKATTETLLPLSEKSPVTQQTLQESTLNASSGNSTTEASKGKSPIAAATESETPSEQKPARPARQRKPKEEKAKPSLSKEEIKLREEVLTWINAKRGFKLYGRATVKEIQTEYSCSHTLAHMLYVRLHEHNEEEGCTWEDLEYTHEYCSKRDNFWKLPDNKIRIGAFAVLQKFAVAMAFKVQQPLINLEDRRNGVMKQAALEHGSRRSFLEEEKAREQSGIWGDLKKGVK